MIEVLGTVVGIAVGLVVLLGALWRWVILPNLREQLALTRETHKQVTDNKHANRHPTILDRLEDIESSLDVVALNQLAVLKRLGRHIGESESDRARLWLMVETLAHEDEERSHRKDVP